MKKSYTPKDIVQGFGLGMELVLGHIHDGTLKASNVSRSKSRPRWIILDSDLDDFFEKLSNQQGKSQMPKANRKSKRKPLKNVPQIV